MNYNNIEKLEELRITIAEFLKKKKDLDIEEIQTVCNAFLHLHLTKDIELTKIMIQPIWNRISKYEQWYFNDIRLINTILFLFPVNVATEFTQSVLARLDKYKDFREAELLKTSFVVNLSLLLIKEKNYVKAYEIINDSLNKYQRRMNYTILALYFSRKAICSFHLGKEDSIIFLKKAQNLALLYDDVEYWERIQKEYDYYT